MKTIVVKTQAELDALPARFDEHTVIRIESGSAWVSVNAARENSHVVARDNSRVVSWGNSHVEARDNSHVEAWDNSRVVAWDNSRVEAWDNSRVVARDNSHVVARYNSHVVARYNSRVEAWGNSRVHGYEFSTLMILSALVVIKHLADKAVCRLRGVDAKIERKDKTAKVLREPKSLSISFETWLERGYVVADGITSTLVSKKKRGDCEVFTVRQSILDDKDSYVVKRGDTFSHGKTVKEAIDSLRYKLSDRDTSRFKKWTLKTKVSVEEAIQAYRAITGACEFGVRSFCESRKIPKSATVAKVIEITSGQYGHEKFKGFFGALDPDEAK